MNRILLNMVSAAILCSMSTAYANDVNVDVDNFNPIYPIDQDYIKNNQQIMDQQFHEYGFTVDHVHSHDELELLTDTIYNKANKAIDGYIEKYDRHIQKRYMERRTEFDLSWLQHKGHGETLTWVENIYKTDLGGLKSSRNNVILDSVARLMQCETDKILHTKNDMVFDRWRDYKKNNLNSINCHRDIWPNNKGNVNYVQALTLLNGSATVHIWQSDLKINRLDENRKEKARQLRLTTKPDMSFKIQYGDTILINPFVEFSIEDEGSLDEIRFLVNEYARYDEKLYDRSIKIPYVTFYNQGFFLDETKNSSNLKNSDDFIILKNLTQRICDESLKAAKESQSNHTFPDGQRYEFSKKEDNQKTISGRWGVVDEIGGWAKNVYKHDLYMLDFIKNDNLLLKTVSQLLGCRIPDILHVKNDIVSDRWMEHDNNIIFNEWGTYKLNELTARDEYNMWRNEKYHSCYITAITSLGADVDLHIWSGTMSIDNSQKDHKKEARAYRKKNKPSQSMIFKSGQTLFINPYVEFSFTPREALSNSVRFYINGFAYPKTCKIKKSVIGDKIQFTN